LITGIQIEMKQIAEFMRMDSKRKEAKSEKKIEVLERKVARLEG